MTMIANIPDSAATVRIGRKLATFIGDCINNWLTAWLAYHERQTARQMLLSFDDRQLEDIGMFRSEISEILKNQIKRD